MIIYREQETGMLADVRTVGFVGLGKMGAPMAKISSLGRIFQLGDAS